jgi:hypothetical protein
MKQHEQAGKAEQLCFPLTRKTPLRVLVRCQKERFGPLLKEIFGPSCKLPQKMRWSTFQHEKL